MLEKNPLAIIMRGMLTKQGDKPNKNVEYRLLLVNSKEIKWYHDEDEMKKGKRPLGVIYLSAVYHCVPANTKMNTVDINIGTCAWRKKDQEKEGRREFIFGARNITERDEWITCIEYLRAKAVYDGFVQKFCNISFTQKSEKQEEDVIHDSRDDKAHLTMDFGLKLKMHSKHHNRQPTAEDSMPLPSRFTRRESLRLNQKLSQPSFVNQANMDNPKELAAKIKKLYNASIVTFVNQVSQNGCKQSNQRNETVKKAPDCLLTAPSFKSISTFITEEPFLPPHQQHQPLSKIRQASMKTVASSKSSDSDGGFPAHGLEDRIVRRISIIGRPIQDQTSEETTQQEVTGYLEDLRSHRNSPLEIKERPENSKIIEENEDDSSSGDNTQKKEGAESPHLGPTIVKPFEKSKTQIKKVTQNLPKKSRVSIQMDLLNNLQRKTRELTFNKTGAQEDENTGNQQELLIFAVNQEKIRTDSKKTIKEQDSSSSSSGSDLEESKLTEVHFERSQDRKDGLTLGQKQKSNTSQQKLSTSQLQQTSLHSKRLHQFV